MSRMNSDEKEDTTVYKVVVNHEEQYSIWPLERENPLGWSDVGKTGQKDECLSYIKEVWTDMRPLSLRKKMEEAAQSQSQPPGTEFSGSEESAPSNKGDDLVKRLSEGNHPVEVGLRSEKNSRRLKECIDRGYVHIKFMNTSGGTELGVRLDPAAMDVSHADFENQTGSVRLAGNLTLNYVDVRCVAEIDLKTLTGQGHLEPIAV
ncbi:MAG TPA: MbtH family NRPS accessory protein [Pyrinomonadaceae bacterium]